MARYARRVAVAAIATGALIFPSAGAFAVEGTTPAPPSASQIKNVHVKNASDGAKKATKERYISVFVELESQPSHPSTSAEAANLAAQANVISTLKSKYGIEVGRQLGYLVNGFAAKIEASQLASLRNEPGIKSVRRERLYYPTQNNADVMQGVSEAVRANGLDGEGLVVSIIDTGIDPTHRDLQMSGADCANAKIKSFDASKNFTCKVPYGYNYADKDGNFTDAASADQHGMHVAGSVAANGELVGIAPKAQLLAMKVFSNIPGNQGAQDSDIVAAIEDSVKLGADVINMSLGSANGIIDTSEGTSLAIQHAREQGVFVVVSAGNDGLNFSPSGSIDDMKGLWDDGPVGSPATSPGAFAVASVENNRLHAHVAYLREEADAEDPTSTVIFNPATGTLDDRPHRVIAAGHGSESDFEEVAEQIEEAVDAGESPFALVERGGSDEDGETLSFADKFTNAYDAGAEGIIVYNHTAGGESFIGIGGVDEYAEYPSASMYHEAGAALAQEAAAGPIYITFSDEVREFDNPEAAQASDFTSWGPTSDLKFKPQIAGIGGNVYSTQNNNKYTTMSGTSMAAPNIAGISALLIQSTQKKYPDMPRADVLNYVETVLMNTAGKVQDTRGVPYGPRRVGAGLANVERAAATQVTATVDNKPYAEIGVLTGAATVNVTLHNYGSEAATFTVPALRALGETNELNESTSFKFIDANVTASAQEVSVPAGGTANLTFTISQPAQYAEGYIEGWLEFVSTNDAQPNLAVPYLGFVGDWNRERIVLAPNTMWEPDYNENVTELRLNYAGGMLGDWAQKNVSYTYRLSPNGDGNFDIIHPVLVLMRNAKDIVYSVLDAQGNEIKVLGEDHDLNRYTAGLAGQETENGELDITLPGKEFNGKVWNAATGEFDVLPDGHYIYRVAARLGEGFDWQYTDFPFEIDTVSPNVTIDSVEDGVATVTVRDTDGSTVDDVFLSAQDQNEKRLEVESVEGDPSKFTVQLPEGTTQLIVRARDYGENIGMAVRVLDEGKFVIANRDALNGAVVGPRYELYMDGHMGIHGYTSADITRVTVAGSDATLDNGLFMSAYKPHLGDNVVSIVAYNAAGDEVDRDTITFTWDDAAPVLTLTQPEDPSHVVPDEDGNITVEGTLIDERPDAALTLTIGGEQVPVGEDGHFTYTGNPDRYLGTSLVVVTGSDGANSAIQILVLQEEDAEDIDYDIHFNNAECMDRRSMCFVIPGTEGVNGDTFQLKGYVTKGAKRVVFTQSSRFNADGTQTANVVEGVIDSNDDFTADLTLLSGMSTVRVQEFDEEGSVISDKVWTFFFDGKAPVVHFDTPSVVNGKIFTREDGPLTLKGTAWDNGQGFTLAVNDSVVSEVFYRTSMGEESTKREFTHDVKVKNNDILYLHFKDFMGNTLAGLVPVVVDKAKPEMSFGIENNRRISAGEKINVKAHDVNISSLAASVCRVDTTGAPTQECVAFEPVKAEKTVGALESTLEDVTALVNGKGDENAGEEENAVRSASGARVKQLVAGRTKPLSANDVTSASAADPSVVAPDGSVDTANVPATDESAEDLTLVADTTGLSAGKYILVAKADDFAANVQTGNLSFTIDAPATIEGPQELELTLKESQLSDPQQASQAVLAHYSVADPDGAINPDGSAAQGEVSVQLKPGTQLHTGEQTVVLIGTDAAGRTFERSVTVKITAAADPIDEGNAGAGDHQGAQPSAGEGSSALDNLGGMNAGGARDSGGHKALPRSYGSKALPVTGVEAGMFAVVGVAFLALGMVIVSRTRRRG